MNERIRDLVSRIQELEQELQAELQQTEKHVLYEISNRKVRFEERVRAAHAACGSARCAGCRRAAPRTCSRHR